MVKKKDFWVNIKSILIKDLANSLSLLLSISEGLSMILWQAQGAFEKLQVFMGNLGFHCGSDSRIQIGRVSFDGKRSKSRAWSKIRRRQRVQWDANNSHRTHCRKWKKHTNKRVMVTFKNIYNNHVKWLFVKVADEGYFWSFGY